MQKKRIGYIDTAKAIAILFIVIGHTGIVYNAGFPGGMPARIVHLAFTFHLPVFFVASGFFFKTDQRIDWTFIKKSARSMILPYVVTCALIVVFATLLAHAEGLGMKSQAIRWTEASIYGAGAQNPHSLVAWERIGGIWFLLGLFWAQIIVLLCCKFRWPIIPLIVLFALGWLSAKYIWLPWSVQSGIMGSLFVYAGVLARKYQAFDRFKLFSPFGMACAVIWAIFVFATLNNPSFAEFILPDGILDIIGMLAAAYTVIAACKALEDALEKHRKKRPVTEGIQNPQEGRFMRAINWVGRNTLAIFAIHILEDDVLLTFWIAMIPSFGAILPIGGWVLFLLARLCVIAAVCAAIYWTPGLSKVYFPRAPKNLR